MSIELSRNGIHFICYLFLRCCGLFDGIVHRNEVEMRPLRGVAISAFGGNRRKKEITASQS